MSSDEKKEECTNCFGRGWHPTWVEDPTLSLGGYEGPEMYCQECPAGERLRRFESGGWAEELTEEE